MNNDIRTVGVVSLGCAKNKVDCEIMLKLLVDAGYELCNVYEECDAIIINTCGFIKEAKEEALDNIFEAATYKKAGLKKLIVTGCLAQRYAEEIKALIPEVDAIISVKGFDRICEALESDITEISVPLTDPHPEGERLLTTDNYSVYLKIAEGCSNRCAYCAIPYIRGNFMPRTKESVLAEAKKLADDGAVEINLIAQDLTRHPDLIDIIKGIAAIDSVKWIRLLYLYPDEITDELIEVMATEEKVVKYIDLPLQHASGSILKKMNRRGKSSDYTRLIKKMRKKMPDLTLRTTFIVGFPGETRADFEELVDFIEKIKFDNMGAFAYSAEDGTPAASFCGQISERTKARRLERLMTTQYGIVQDASQKQIGKTLTILCEGMNEDGLYKGRSQYQAPEVDGNVYFSSEELCIPGNFYQVKIESNEHYDLYGSKI
jgi:ribosomal protein S12 methylthiotransferase